MSEFINPITQTVATNSNVLFSETVVEPCCKVRHRKGSGVFTLKGGRYLVYFGGNVAIPTGATLAPITVAISIGGEALVGGTMVITPQALDETNVISAMVCVEVPCNCCYTLTVQNKGTTAITVDDANLVIIKEV